MWPDWGRGEGIGELRSSEGQDPIPSEMSAVRINEALRKRLLVFSDLDD